MVRVSGLGIRESTIFLVAILGGGCCRKSSLKLPYICCKSVEFLGDDLWFRV